MASIPSEVPRASRMASAFEPLRRLFAPQVSSAARERRDMTVLLLAVALVVLPHFEHLPWWAASVLMLLLVWRGFLTLAQQPLPGRMMMLPLLIAAAFAAYLQHGTLVGQQAGVTFLLLLMALKLLEMRARRDIFVVIFLSFFILLTQFMHSQALPVAVMTLLAVAALFFVLVSVNLDETDLPAGRKMKLVGWTLLKALPLTAVLFVLFPRISGPLWGSPGDGNAGNTGLSNTMAPGSISRLLESAEIAFRAKFDGAVPTNDKLYWRGPVFGLFNGRSWSALGPRFPETPLRIEADPASAVAYTVTIEPHHRDWLFALEAPAELPKAAELNARLTPELQLLAGDLIRQRVRYDMRSYTSFRLEPHLEPADLRDSLALPSNYNPRTIEFAAELRQRVVDSWSTRGEPDLQLVRAALDHFRNGSYHYTLEAPRLGRHAVDEFLLDTKLGYCEHFSSAFVVLMRAMGVPARVVTGYQGGELNPIDGFMTVRQSDAHAWAEAWLQGRGWVRVDPTAVVAPLRIERGVTEVARQSGLILPGTSISSGWLRSLRFNWEAVQNGWNQWVLSYSQERQRALVELIGLAPRWESVAVAMGVAVAVLLIGMALASLRPRTVRDPLGDIFQQMRVKLEQAGVHAAEHHGPRALYRRARSTLAKNDAQRARKLLSRYERMRYSRSSESVAAADIRALRRAVRAFRPSPEH
jgi:transglutaminase-like putative cysteine protease